MRQAWRGGDNFPQKSSSQRRLGPSLVERGGRKTGAKSNPCLCVNLDPSRRWDDADLWPWCWISGCRAPLHLQTRHFPRRSAAKSGACQRLGAWRDSPSAGPGTGPGELGDCICGETQAPARATPRPEAHAGIRLNSSLAPRWQGIQGWLCPVWACLDERCLILRVRGAVTLSVAGFPLEGLLFWSAR